MVLKVLFANLQVLHHLFHQSLFQDITLEIAVKVYALWIQRIYISVQARLATGAACTLLPNLPATEDRRPTYERFVESVYCNNFTCSCDSFLVGMKKPSIIMSTNQPRRPLRKKRLILYLLNYVDHSNMQTERNTALTWTS